MGKLIISDGQGQAREVQLDKERLSIGRHPDNDIALDDKAVSGRHAAIITILRDSFLEDLHSTNGTVVNGRPITKHPLSHGDEIVLGRHRLRYEGEPATTDDEDDFEKTMILKPGQFGAAFDAQVDQAAGSAAAAPPAPTVKPSLAKLQVANGPNKGKELELVKALTTIGRPGIQVAAITRRADGYYIVQVGGSGGGKHPQVNGEDLSSKARKLKHLDKIELVGTTMTFLQVD